jgi:guanyl-specific ribonuclease Sa
LPKVKQLQCACYVELEITVRSACLQTSSGRITGRLISWLLVLAVLSAFVMTAERGLNPVAPAIVVSGTGVKLGALAKTIDTSEAAEDAALLATLARIKAGTHYPHRNDGSVFQNREGLLPRKPAGYYHEYVHPTPGVSGPGARRVIKGEGGEFYYSDDHYQSFALIEER